MYNWTLLHIIAIVPLILLGARLAQNLKTEGSKYFFFSITFMIFLLISSFIMVNAQNVDIATSLHVLTCFILSLFVAFFALCVLTFRKESTAKESTISFIPAFLSIAFIQQYAVKLTEFGWHPVFNVINAVWMVSLLAVGLYAIWILIGLRAQVTSKKLRRHMSILASSVSLALILWCSFTIISDLLTFPFVSSIVAAFALMLAYFAFR